MRQRGWRRETGRWRRGSAGCGKRRRRWPEGRTGSSRTRKGTPPPRMWRKGCGPEEGQRGGRGSWAAKGEAAPGGGTGSGGSRGGATAGQHQPGADVDGLGLGVATAAAVCAAAGTGWRAGDVAELVSYLKWAGRTRGGREKRGTRPFSDLVVRPGRPKEKGPQMEEGRWRMMLGEALPGVRLDCPRKPGEKAQGAEAAGAVAAGRVAQGRAVGRGRSRTAVHILVNTWARGTRRVQGGRTD